MIIPAKDSDSILEAEDYNFDWNITEFNQTEIEILVNFTTPGSISTLDNPDRLRVLFNNTSEFMIPLDDELEVMPNGIQVFKSIPPQIVTGNLLQDIALEEIDTAVYTSLLLSAIHVALQEPL